MERKEFKTLLEEYEEVNSEYETVKEHRTSLKKFVDAEFKKAYQHAQDFLLMYLEIGTSGFFGVMAIRKLLERYEKGERTFSLYADMMNIE